MRVLVVDQDSASNEAIVRSLRDLYTVDAVTNKGDCLDLLRSNTFEVIVAGERLADGSGLELLGQIARKWPSVLRIFAADRHRLKLLRGRLGPFELFQTLSYPIDPERLIATLSLADAAQDANADTANIQHVVLSSESPADVSEDTREPAESVASTDFPAPRPASRISPVEHAEAPSRNLRGAGRGGPAHRARPAPPGQRLRGNGAAGPPTGSSGARGVAVLPSLPSFGGRPPRYDSSRGASNKAPKASPVRFPPLPKVPSLEPARASRANRSGISETDTFAAAATMARTVRSNFDSPVVESNARRLAIMMGGGAAVVLALVVLGYKLLDSRSEPPRPAPPPVVHAPEYPQEVTDLIAQTEATLKSDDLKAARADVDRLRQLAPSHPRLAFFEGVLAQRAERPKPGHASSSAGRATAKRNGQSRRNGVKAAADNKKAASADSAGSSLPKPAPTSVATPAHADTSVSPLEVPTPAGSAPEAAPVIAAPALTSGAPTLPAPTPAPATATWFPVAPSAPAHAQAAAPAQEAPARASAVGPSPAVVVSAPASAPTPAVARAPASASTAPAPATIGAAVPTVPPGAHVHPSTPLKTEPASPGEPPPVVREAKLIRRVSPDYPSAAKREGFQGSVDLEVTVSARGVVEEVVVVRATPPGMFEKSALAAVRKWRYDPRFVDGLPSEAHLNVHLDFPPE